MADSGTAWWAVMSRGGRRVVVTVLGLALLLAGAVMVVTPGPGAASVIAGLALLATEYTWARRMLHRARRRVEQARDRVRERRRGSGGVSA